MQVATRSGPWQSLSLIVDVQVRNWGSELVLECLDDPLTRRRYQLVYKNCREIRWSLLDAEPTPAVEADVIGICPGQAEHAEPAVLTTDVFELTVLYDRLEIRELPPAA